MILPPSEPIYVTSDLILNETAIGLAVMEQATKAFQEAEPFTGDIVALSKKYMSIENNKMYQIFEKLRRWAFEGNWSFIEPEEVQFAFLFLSTVWQLRMQFQFQGPAGSNVTVQAAFARDKLCEVAQWDDPMIHPPMYFIDFRDRIPHGNAEGVTVRDLSLLTGLKAQSIRNALHTDKSIRRVTGISSRQLEVEPEDAYKWLQGKGWFNEYVEPSSELDYSVPVAKDGSFFNAACKRSKGYTIGKKGDEWPYESFTEALENLKKMPSPYWRRPSATTGVAGIVKGIRWEVKSRKELGLD